MYCTCCGPVYRHVVTRGVRITFLQNFSELKNSMRSFSLSSRFFEQNVALSASRSSKVHLHRLNFARITQRNFVANFNGTGRKDFYRNYEEVYILNEASIDNALRGFLIEASEHVIKFVLGKVAVLSFSHLPIYISIIFCRDSYFTAQLNISGLKLYESCPMHLRASRLLDLHYRS